MRRNASSVAVIGHHETCHPRHGIAARLPSIEQTPFIVRVIARCEVGMFAAESPCAGTIRRLAVARWPRSATIATHCARALEFLRRGDQYGQNLP
jgi:hypothetical protein